MFFYRWNMDEGSVNLQAIRRSKEIMEYIYDKNRAIYDEYFGNPIHSIQQANYLQQEMDKLLASRKYRIGSLIANPWRMIKKWFKGWTKVADVCSVCQKWKNNEKSEKEEE